MVDKNKNETPADAKTSAATAAFEALLGAPVDMTEFQLSRPLFIASKCQGPLTGVFLYVAGPFAPGKNPLPGKDANKPWFAYVVKLTKPCQVLNPDKEKITAQKGEEVMLPIAAQLRNIAPYALDDKFVHELELTPGPNPEAGKMRTWKGKTGRRVPRGNAFPLLKTGSVPLALPQASEVDDDTDNDIPFGN